MRHMLLVMAIFVATLPVGTAHAGTQQRLSADIGSVRMTVFAYRPTGCTPRGIILVFHGYTRDARQYRDFAEPVANSACAFVFAPRFDADRFPTADYQRGGVTQNRASLASASVSLVPGLIVWARSVAGSTLPVMLLGHSAGAQFLARVAAYVPNAARVMVLANPSTYVMPNINIPAPYGGGFTTPDRTWLGDYLKRPIVILSGADDDTDAHNMANSAQAQAQGANRMARGDAAFAMAQSAAQGLGIRCAWQHLVVPNTGHNAAAMFASSQLAKIAQTAFNPAP